MRSVFQWIKQSLRISCLWLVATWKGDSKALYPPSHTCFWSSLAPGHVSWKAAGFADSHRPSSLAFYSHIPGKLYIMMEWVSIKQMGVWDFWDVRFRGSWSTCASADVAPPKRAEMVFSRSCVYIWVVETCLVCAGSLNLISLQYPKRNRCGHRSGLFPFSFANKFFLRVVLKILFVFLRLLCYPGWPWTHVAESNL